MQIVHYNTVRTYRLFTRAAIVCHWSFMHSTVLYFTLLSTLALQTVKRICNLIKETTVYKLVDTQTASTMRTLLFCLRDPLP